MVESGRRFTIDNIIRSIVTASGVNITVTTPDGREKLLRVGASLLELSVGFVLCF